MQFIWERLTLLLLTDWIRGTHSQWRSTISTNVDEVEQWLDGPRYGTDAAGPPIVDDEDWSEQYYSLWGPPSDLWERKYQKSAGAHEFASGGQPLRETRMMITGWKG